MIRRALSWSALTDVVSVSRACLATKSRVEGVNAFRPPAWLGKITCKRLESGKDVDAYKSAAFLSTNLLRGTTTAQTWQFLGAAINAYCPDQLPALQQAAGHTPSAVAPSRDALSGARSSTGQPHEKRTIGVVKR
jgi:Protein of unknown function (DUF732)